MGDGDVDDGDDDDGDGDDDDDRVAKCQMFYTDQIFQTKIFTDI